MKLTKIAFYSTLVCTIKLSCLVGGVILYTFQSPSTPNIILHPIQPPSLYANENTPVKQQVEQPSQEDPKLSAKEKELLAKEKELKALEESVTASLNEIEVAQKKLTQLINELKGEQDKQLQHLIDVYSNMKPQQAGMVLETLDETIAVRILSGMKGRKAGEILSFVEPKKAAKLSERLTQIHMNSLSTK